MINSHHIFIKNWIIIYWNVTKFELVKLKLGPHWTKLVFYFTIESYLNDKIG
jgi:hypothetical protein